MADDRGRRRVEPETPDPENAIFVLVGVVGTLLVVVHLVGLVSP